jgi:hypothetical protein
MGHALLVFVATRREDVPPGCDRYLSVDGSVPGAACTWDHHVTGERINLEAMPNTFDASGYHGVGTTMADADALASVVAVLAGGKARLRPETRAVLESASYWCDHLCAHPEHSEGTNRLGRGLLDAVDSRLGGRGRRADARAFATLCHEIADLVDRGEPLPFSDVWREELERARALVAEGRLRLVGDVALVDLRDARGVDPAALYAQHDRPVSVHVELHADGGCRYSVGVHPGVPTAPRDIRPALVALSQAEFAHGPPALAPSPGPGSENWGGRARVFGSPWNYGSRLHPDEVTTIVTRSLGLRLS